MKIELYTEMKPSYYNSAGKTGWFQHNHITKLKKLICKNGLCKKVLSSPPWCIRHRVPWPLNRSPSLPHLRLPVLQGTHHLFCCREHPVISRMLFQMVDGGLPGDLAVLGVLKLVLGACCEIGIGVLGFPDRHSRHQASTIQRYFRGRSSFGVCNSL
jgi:hypothetical protein